MPDAIFGAANKVEFFDVDLDADTVTGSAYVCSQIVSSELQRNGDLSWNISLTQDEDSGALQTFIEANVNADDDGGSDDTGKYQDGTDRPTASSSGSGSAKLVFAVVYGGVNDSSERKLWSGFVKLLASSGGYSQAADTLVEPNIDMQSVKAPFAVTITETAPTYPVAEAGLDSTLVATGQSDTVAVDSYGRPYHLTSA